MVSSLPLMFLAPEGEVLGSQVLLEFPDCPTVIIRFTLEAHQLVDGKVKSLNESIPTRGFVDVFLILCYQLLAVIQVFLLTGDALFDFFFGERVGNHVSVRLSFVSMN